MAIDPRPDFGQKLEKIGLSFHSWDNYWKEDVCYRFSARQVDLLEEATRELHRMCIEAVRFVIGQNRFAQLGIPEAFERPVRESFTRQDFTLYGRFDLAYDGNSAPKLLEYNADTPTSLLESAVAQWYWLEECFPQHDQFNSLHDRLVERWKQLGSSVTTIYFASSSENEEDWVCTTYLMDTATQAGYRARHIYMEDIGWHAAGECFVDLDGRPIEALFKLYPWEWLMREEFGKNIAGATTRFIEPIWKSVLACKGLLPILWEMYPGHPNLLPAYFEPGKLDSYAKKPLYSREGANVELYRNGRLLRKTMVRTAGKASSIRRCTLCRTSAAGFR
jgi:glutathionylspermidine synthase